MPLVVLAGKEYGSGSSRDWAAKGPKLLGVRAVIAESYERIHRSNLVGMGVLPLQFAAGENASSRSGLTGEETFDVPDIGARGRSARRRSSRARRRARRSRFTATVRIDTPQEWLYYRHGGILQFVLRQLLRAGRERRLIYALGAVDSDRARELLDAGAQPNRAGARARCAPTAATASCRTSTSTRPTPRRSCSRPSGTVADRAAGARAGGDRARRAADRGGDLRRLGRERRADPRRAAGGGALGRAHGRGAVPRSTPAELRDVRYDFVRKLR